PRRSKPAEGSVPRRLWSGTAGLSGNYNRNRSSQESLILLLQFGGLDRELGRALYGKPYSAVRRVDRSSCALTGGSARGSLFGRPQDQRSTGNCGRRSEDEGPARARHGALDVDRIAPQAASGRR